MSNQQTPYITDVPSQVQQPEEKGVPELHQELSQPVQSPVPSWMTAQTPVVATPAPVAEENPFENPFENWDELTNESPVEVNDTEETQEEEDVSLTFTKEGKTPPTVDVDTADIMNSIFNDVLSTDKEARTEQAKKDGMVRITVPRVSADTLTEGLVNVGKAMGKVPFDEALNDRDSLPSTCRDAYDFYSAQANLLKESLVDLNTTVQSMGKTLKDVLKDKVSYAPVSTTKSIPQLKTKNLTGQSAVTTVAAVVQGIKRVPLLNSGFYITLKSVTMREIASFFNTVNVNGYIYGRELGAYYYMYVDIELKRQILENILPFVVVSSNYEQYKRKDKLLKAISFQDYDALLHAIASMMYRDGVDITTVCMHDDCRSTSTFRAELEKLRFTDETLYNDACKEWMSNPDTKRTDKDLQTYRTLLNMNDTFFYKISNTATGLDSYWQFVMTPASCKQYLDSGDLFNKSLFAFAANPDKEEVKEYITINYYKTFAPWIESIACVTEEAYTEKTIRSEADKLFEIKNTPENADSISQILDIHQMEEQGFGLFAMKYIRDTKITKILLPLMECPHCHRLPDTGVDGFVPYDVQSLFFLMCLMRMLKTA